MYTKITICQNVFWLTYLTSQYFFLTFNLKFADRRYQYEKRKEKQSQNIPFLIKWSLNYLRLKMYNIQKNNEQNIWQLFKNALGVITIT